MGEDAHRTSTVTNNMEPRTPERQSRSVAV